MISMVQRLSLIIPAYNEAETLSAVLSALHALSLPGIEKEIIVVNDGSNDGTEEVLEQLQRTIPLRVYMHATNRGKGASIHTGLTHATGDFVLFHDADLEYAPHDILRLLACMQKTGADAVYGTRMTSKHAQFASLLQRGGNIFLSFVTRVLYGGKVSDMETGYKLLKRSALQDISLHEKGFGIEPELTAHLLLLHRRIVEVPISFRARTQGKKLHYLRDGLRALFVLVKYRVKGSV